MNKKICTQCCEKQIPEGFYKYCNKACRELAMRKAHMKRTNLQNRSIHSWFTEVSRELNEAGIDYQTLVKGLRVDSTPEMIKATFRQIGLVKYEKKSTADLTSKELQGCWEEMNRMLASVGVHCPFHEVTNTEDYLSSFVQ